MGLVLRRAVTAWSLLAAAAGAALAGTVLLTGSTVHARQVLDDGARTTIGSASRDERSVVLRGPLTRYAERDAAVRAATTPFGGVDTRVRSAGYAAARQFAGDTGTAVPDADGRVYASVVFLEGLDAHADLVAGAWPRAGASPVQVSLAEAAAADLGVRAGERVSILNRLTEQRSEVLVTGVWRPRQAAEPYWQLYPSVAEGAAPGSSTYGPVVLDRADFMAGYTASASVAWVVEPDLAGVAPERLDTLATAAARASEELPAAVGYQSSAVVVSRMDALVRRLHQADLVGRSALATPMLLLTVLGGYTLMLIALLLTEQRRAETALLRARGAGRGRLAGFAVREVSLVVAPAVLLAPWLGTAAAHRVAGTAGPPPWPDRYAWAVAALAAAGCAVTMLLPVLRSGGTYVAALAARSRPSRRTAAQRAGLDLALVALAVLAWFQLRQYAAPVATSATGELRLDPLLVAAPTLGVLAGAALGLRTLPLLTRLAQRQADRRDWVAGTLGMWQAGRRAHAGPVLLLALAVAVSALAWCLSGTAQRSVVDQADHVAGADLQVTRVATATIAATGPAAPGVRTTLPVVRDSLRLGTGGQEGTMVALDAARAAGAVNLRPDLAGGDPGAVFAGLTAARAPDASVPLPPGRLTGEIRVTGPAPSVRTEVVLASDAGGNHRLPLTAEGSGAFAVDVPAGARWRLVGFAVTVRSPADSRVQWRLSGLRAGGVPVDLGPVPGWRVRDPRGDPRGTSGTATAGDALTMQYTVPPLDYVPLFGDSELLTTTLLVDRPPPAPRVPVVASDAALAALRLKVGDTTRLALGPLDVDVRITGAVRAVPGTTDPAALLVDLPSLATAQFDDYGVVTEPAEWWLATRPGEHAAAAAAVAASGGVQVRDPRESARVTAGEPYGRGARAALFAAASGAVLLAGLGLIVDARATARRRSGEWAVLHVLGAGPRTLARSLVAEQGVLAGVGLVVGVLVGIGVAATLAPLVILTPSGGRPVPTPLLHVPWAPVLLSAVLLAASTLALSALIALTVRRRLAATHLRVGAEVAP